MAITKLDKITNSDLYGTVEQNHKAMATKLDRPLMPTPKRHTSGSTPDVITISCCHTIFKRLTLPVCNRFIKREANPLIRTMNTNSEFLIYRICNKVELLYPK